MSVQPTGARNRVDRSTQDEPPRLPAVLLTILLAASPLIASAGEVPGGEAVDELIRRALELRVELEELLDGLTPEAREELERRWRELREEAPDDGPPAAEPPMPERPRPADPEPRPEPDVQGKPEAPAEASDRPTGLAPDSEPVEDLAAAPDPPAVENPAPDTASELSDDEEAETCDTLILFDSNGDDVLSGSDRYWRHFYLWLDDGDGQIEDKEIERLFEAGIRRISVRLRSYDSRKGASGDVWIDDGVRLDLLTRGRSANLVIDAEKLRGGDELLIRDASGARLGGMQALRSGLVIESVDGRQSRLLCH